MISALAGPITRTPYIFYQPTVLLNQFSGRFLWDFRESCRESDRVCAAEKRETRPDMQAVSIIGNSAGTGPDIDGRKNKSTGSTSGKMMSFLSLKAGRCP